MKVKHGVAWVYVQHDRDPPREVPPGLCEKCEGTGQRAYCPPEDACPACLGTGMIGAGNLTLDLGMETSLRA